MESEVRVSGLASGDQSPPEPDTTSSQRNI